MLAVIKSDKSLQFNYSGETAMGFKELFGQYPYRNTACTNR